MCIRDSFFFRTPTGATGVAAANLAEFHDALLRSDMDVIRHHVANGDFSRWIADVVQDRDLATEVRELERGAPRETNVERLRAALVSLIERRYPEAAADPMRSAD